MRCACYMKNRNLIPVLTADGSYTLYHKDLNEHFHSKDGAIGESIHVYIKNGLERLDSNVKSIKILEVGVGTGTNVILTYQWAKEQNVQINYYGLEPFPITNTEFKFLLDNTSLFKKEEALFTSIHNVENDEVLEFDDIFKFSFLLETIQAFNSESFLNSFDIIFFDAFAPSKQEEMWDLEVLKKCYEILKPNGILATYCASGKFKRNLKESGFEIIKEKGFGSKREIFVGKKNPVD